MRGTIPIQPSPQEKTVLTGDLSIRQNADNLWLEGIEITGKVLFYTNHKVDFVTIRRCKFSLLEYSGNRTTACEENVIRENVISGGVNLGNANLCVLSNNIIGGTISYANNSGISNNVLLNNPNSASSISSTFYYVSSSSISNNIIFRNYGGTGNVHYSCDLNTFSNNIFTLVPDAGTNTFTDNYSSIDITTVFVNQSGNVFDYTHDYHLANPATYLGTDGTQVGIYGGMFPYKDGAVPHNPHIQFKNIAPTTDVNGELQIQIQVEAQND